MPSARRAPREVLPSTATALNRLRASQRLGVLGGLPGTVAAHAGRLRPARTLASDFVLVRGDLKTGRSGSRTPSRILAGHYRTGGTRDRDL